MFKLLLISSLILTSSCTNSLKKGFKDAKYGAYEMIGYEKRDLFKKEVKAVKKDQDDSQKAFEDALAKLQYFYSYDGGKTESEYNKLKDSYESSRDESENLSASIQKLDEVARDLFAEWKEEINGISNSDLRKKSTVKLSETRIRYRELHQKLKNSEKNMSPILVKMKDQVTFLKHNLNAGAISGLQTEGDRIEQDIEKLIKEMKTANREAEDFIKTL